MASKPQPAAQSLSGTTLHGRIEAIGVQELLRVSIANGSTGRLLLFNDEQDAELYYEEGRLVAAVSGAGSGTESLSCALGMAYGEFEFVAGAVIEDERKDARLHEALLHAVREFYERKLRDKSPDLESPAFTSGVHKLTPSAKSAGEPVTASAETVRASAWQARDDLAVGETGRGLVEMGGHVIDHAGSFSTNDAAFAALIVKLGNSLGAALGQSSLTGFELSVPDKQAILGNIREGTMRITKTSGESDLQAIRERLES